MMRDTRKGDIDGCVCVVAMSFEAYCIVRDTKLEKNFNGTTIYKVIRRD